MIDVENIVIDAIINGLDNFELDVDVIDTYNEEVESFPCVTVEQVDNETDLFTMEANNTEVHALVRFEFNIYTNDASEKRIQAQKIAKKINEIMAGMGFIRTMFMPIPNLADVSIHRRMLQFTARVSRDNITYTI